MRLTKWFALLSSLSLILAPEASAQFLGNVAIQTVQAQLATAGVGAGTCTGNPQNFITNQGIANFDNIGQTIHQASASSTAASFTMEIDGIDVLGNVVRISSPTVQYQPTNAINGYVAQGSGYYPNIQVTVTCTASATFSLSYSGSTGGGGSAILTTPGTSPLISPTLAADVQGIFPRNFNGGSAFPLITGALGPAINSGISTMGVDNFSTIQTFVPSGTTGNVTLGFPPQPSNAGEFVIVYYSPVQSVGGIGVVAPYTALSSSTGAGDINVAYLANYTTKNGLVESFTNGGGMTTGLMFTAFAKAPTFGNEIYRSAASTTAFTPVAGATLLTGFTHSGAGACTSAAAIPSVSDTQGNNFKLIAAVTSIDNLSTTRCIVLFAATAVSAASDTITATTGTGTIDFTALTELRNITVAGLNTPSIPVFASNPLNSGNANENDNGGLFTESGGYNVQQSVTLGTGTTTFPLFQQPLSGVFYSCTVALRVTAASGTTPTLNTYLQDSGDNIGFNDRLSFPQAVTTGTFLGAVSGGIGGITPAATTDGTLAAGSKLDGPLSSYARIKFIVGGTTPSFTLTYNVACR